jgi:predicted nucleotide-binding protein (sugar kinase/HSP70/actin superfamily)
MNPFLFKGYFSLQLYYKQCNSFHSHNRQECKTFKYTFSFFNTKSINMSILNELSQIHHGDMFKLKLCSYAVKVNNEHGNGQISISTIVILLSSEVGLMVCFKPMTCQTQQTMKFSVLSLS